MKYQDPYIQPLRVGLDNFVAAFGRTLSDRLTPDMLVGHGEISRNWRKRDFPKLA
jgi:hypothetical protein